MRLLGKGDGSKEGRPSGGFLFSCKVEVHLDVHYHVSHCCFCLLKKCAESWIVSNSLHFRVMLQRSEELKDLKK